MRTPPPELADRLWEVGDRMLEPGSEVRIDELSELTGIARATLYYYFAGKEDLVAFLLAQQLQRGAHAVAEAASNEGDSADRLAAVVRAMLRLMAEHPALCTRLMGWMANEGTSGQLMSEVERAVMGPVQRLLAEGQACGDLTVDDLTDTTLSIMGAVSMVAMVHTARADYDPDDAAEHLISQILDGLRPRRC